MHTASNERMAPELIFSSKRVPQLSKHASKVQWPLRFAFSYVQPVTQRYRQKTAEEVPLQQSSHYENMTICMPPTIIASKVLQPLQFAFSYVQPVTQHYK